MADDNDDAAEAFAVVNVIVIVADKRRRWWPSIATRWDSTIAPAPGGKICGEGTAMTTMLPPPYDSLQLAIQEKGYAGCHDSGAAAPAHSSGRR